MMTKVKVKITQDSDVKVDYMWLHSCQDAEEVMERIWEEWPEDYEFFDVDRNKVDKFEVQIVPQNFTLTIKQKHMVNSRVEDLKYMEIRELSDDDVEFLSWHKAYRVYQYHNVWYRKIWRWLKNIASDKYADCDWVWYKRGRSRVLFA
jgi:hypothetical protein